MNLILRKNVNSTTLLFGCHRYSTDINSYKTNKRKINFLFDIIVKFSENTPQFTSLKDVIKHIAT